jgi:hypothetical protein
MHQYLDATQGDAALATIDSFFAARAKRFETQFEALQKEYSKKRKQPKN